MDPDGNWEWATKAGGFDSERDYGITIDDNGNSYITGFFQNTTFFGSYTLISSGYNFNDIFAAKMDTNGNWLWANQAGGSEWLAGNDIAIDINGEIYLTGIFENSTIFGSHSLVSNGSSEIFVAKLGINTSLDSEISPNNITLINYPNPFNPSTEIRFQASDCSKDESVEIEIYNIKGQKIRTFQINSLTDQPINSVVWNGDNENNNPVSSGIYFYKLKTGDKALATKKCLLLK
ncbi:MAG: T9SS type A sorting domain-containing protein [Candidatus Tenebribacter burtonii]|nr:T9SS type A sorting domain-containing protein [Candidatus Tenebribacter burtonii]